MVVMEKRPELSLPSSFETGLQVKRTDISFHDVPGNQVRIQVTVHNPGTHRSPGTVMLLKSAAFGAFLPWRPLTELTVPPLEAGESRDLSVEVPRPRPSPLGDIDKVPPKKLLTAISAEDDASEGANGLAMSSLYQKFLRSTGRKPSSLGKVSARKTSLAPDVWDLLGRGQHHWAGNINVFCGNQPVERHVAKALRVYPGHTNTAFFMVGSPRMPDAFLFELRGLARNWEAVLFDTSDLESLLVGSWNVPIEEREWIESSDGLMLNLAVHPPADCTSGNLEVHVTKRSSGQTAVVEFNLDPGAQGPGCYVV